MSTVDEILEQAMRLEADDRAALVHRLLDTFGDDAAGHASDEWRALWTAEIERRFAAYKRGEIAAFDARESIEFARRSLPRT